MTNLNPLRDKIVVQVIPPAEVSKGGIFIPEQARVPTQEALVVAVGPGTWESGVFVETKAKIGDRVLISKYAGAEVRLNGVDLMIMTEEGIYATLEESEEAKDEVQDSAA